MILTLKKQTKNKQKNKKQKQKRIKKNSNQSINQKKAKKNPFTECDIYIDQSKNKTSESNTQSYNAPTILPSLPQKTQSKQLPTNNNPTQILTKDPLQKSLSVTSPIPNLRTDSQHTLLSSRRNDPTTTRPIPTSLKLETQLESLIGIGCTKQTR